MGRIWLKYFTQKVRDIECFQKKIMGILSFFVWAIMYLFVELWHVLLGAGYPFATTSCHHTVSETAAIRVVINVFDIYPCSGSTFPSLGG